MSDVILKFENVWKKFKKGEWNHDSLRDFLPHIGKKILLGKKEETIGTREFWALKDVSFSVGRGEALGIIGPNGAGKSTILKLLSNIMKPTRGNINVGGRLSALIEVGAGFHPDLTGRENIFLNGAILGMKRSEIQRKIDAIIEFSGLNDFIDTPVKRYSTGMYARLGFSVAAHVDPEILLVDEVLSVGDYTFQHKCIRRINEVVRDGTTVVFISHNIPSILKLCPTTILLNKGEVQMRGSSGEVCRFYYRSNAVSNAREEGSIGLENIRLLTGDGGISNTFRPGDWASVKLSATSACKSDRLFMGFMIKKREGEIVFDANSDKISDIWYSFGENETKEIEVRFRVNLPQGEYFLGIHFMDGMNQYCFFDDELVEFYVQAPITLGNAFLDVHWDNGGDRSRVGEEEEIR